SVPSPAKRATVATQKITDAAINRCSLFMIDSFQSSQIEVCESADGCPHGFHCCSLRSFFIPSLIIGNADVNSTDTLSAGQTCHF
ncbi:MAG: hypothetical protein ACO21J_10840, partial [Anaerohalosphaeraceae bacterium]